MRTALRQRARPATNALDTTAPAQRDAGRLWPRNLVCKVTFCPPSDFAAQAFPLGGMERLEALRLLGTKVACEVIEKGTPLVFGAIRSAKASCGRDELVGVPALPSLHVQDVRRENRQESGEEVMQPVRSVRGKTGALDGRAFKLRIQVATQPRLSAVLVAAHEAGAELHRSAVVLRRELLRAREKTVQRLLRVANDAGYLVQLVERNALVIDCGNYLRTH